MASPFSGTAGRLAGMWAAGRASEGLGQQMTILADAEQRAGGYLTEGYGTGRDVLGSGYADMLESLKAAYGAAPGQLTAGRDAGVTALRGGETSALGSITDARDAALGYGQQAIDQTQAGYGSAMTNFGNTMRGASGLYDPLISKANTGYDMLNNALGLGGAAGTAAAQGAFKAGPGYQWQVEQATDAAQRAGNKIGALYGGNTTDAVTRLGSNLANQEYGNWIKNLQPYQGAALQATAGKAGIEQNMATGMAGLETGQVGALNTLYGNQGKIQTDAGNAMSGIQRGTAQDVAGLEAKTGAALSGLTVDEGQQYAKTAGDYSSALASLAGGYGSGMAGLITGTAGNMSAAAQAANNTIVQAGTGAMMAGQQAAANSWGAALGVLGAGTKLLGGGSTGGFGSLIGSLFK